jgi:hypothetical protein
MTVCELIEELKKVDQALCVYVPTGMDWREVLSLEICAVDYKDDHGYCLPVTTDAGTGQEMGVFVSPSERGNDT